MPLNISLGSSSGSPPAAGLTIPLRLALPGAGSTSEREGQFVRVVAAAVAVVNLAEALNLVEKAKKNRGEVVNPDVKQNEISPILDAVDRALADRKIDNQPDPVQTAAADAVGADLVLVAAACSALEALTNDQRKLVAKWIAAINVERLEQAARAVAPRRQLEFLPSQARQAQQIETRLKALEDAADASKKHEAQLKKQETDLNALRRDAEKARKDAEKARQDAEKALDKLEARLTALEKAGRP